MKFNYSQLNEKSLEELKQIRENVMGQIQQNEDARQSLIRNILFLQEFSDLYSIKNGVFGITP